MAATQGRIAGASNTAKPVSVQPAAHDTQFGAGTEQEEEPLHAFAGEQVDQTPATVEVHSRFRSAQIGAVQIGRWKGTLPVGIDADVTAAEWRAVELLPNEATRLASSIQPGGKPPQFQRQIDGVHYAPCKRRCDTEFRGALCRHGHSVHESGRIGKSGKLQQLS